MLLSANGKDALNKPSKCFQWFSSTVHWHSTTDKLNSRKIFQHLHANKLSLSPDKTCYSIFGNYSHISNIELFLDGQQLETIDNI